MSVHFQIHPTAAIFRYIVNKNDDESVPEAIRAQAMTLPYFTGEEICFGSWAVASFLPTFGFP